MSPSALRHHEVVRPELVVQRKVVDTHGLTSLLYIILYQLTLHRWALDISIIIVDETYFRAFCTVRSVFQCVLESSGTVT